MFLVSIKWTLYDVFLLQMKLKIQIKDTLKSDELKAEVHVGYGKEEIFLMKYFLFK